MRSLTFVALCAGSAAAQSAVTLLNIWQDQSTLTQIGSDAMATTYINSCASDKAGISALPSDSRPRPDSITFAATVGMTPKARLARQARSTVTQAAPAASASSSSNNDDDDSDDDGICEPFTLKQGPSTWEFHLKDPTPGAWTLDMACNWQGAITSADLICTVTNDGYVPDSSDLGVQTTIFSQSDIQSMSALQEVTIVTASPTSSGSSRSAGTSGTKSASGAVSATGTAIPGAAKSTGFAPSKALPPGGVMFVGSAAGILVAALAL